MSINPPILPPSWGPAPNGRSAHSLLEPLYDYAEVTDARLDDLESRSGTYVTQDDATALAEATLASARAYTDAAATRVGWVWDETLGEYDNDSITRWLANRRTTLIYGVDIPAGLATDCTKTHANAGIPNPTPGVIGTPAIDPYLDRSPFLTIEVNGYIDHDGVPHVTAISGDAHFTRDGTNGDVWILAPVLYWRMVEGGDPISLDITDTPRPGFAPQPKALLPTGQPRPYMLYAKYPLSIVDGVARSISGRPCQIRDVSHNSLIAQCRNGTTGYSGKSFADDWYLKTMFLLKYATKNSQSVFSGCTSHAQQVQPSLAEDATTRVVVTTAQAGQFPVGSAVMLGTNDPDSTDRALAQLFDVFDARTITGKTPVDAAATALEIAGPPFDVRETYRISTAPWWTGACDSVVGDGSPTAPTSGREPFVVQGVELGHGVYETLGDVILASDGSTGWIPHLVQDSRNAATSVTGAYVSTGVSIPVDGTNSWKHTLHPADAGGLLIGQGAGGSTSTGMGDGSYSSTEATVGTRQWQGLGYLDNGGTAGVWCVYGDVSLGNVRWYFGSRLSAIGRSGG